MRSNHEPEMRFWMALYGKNIDLAGIEELLHIKLDNNRINVPDDLPEDPDGPIFYEEIAWLLNLAEKNDKEMKALIWMIYYYDKQCNMEFDAGLMGRMGKLGLKLCVSCQEI